MLKMPAGISESIAVRSAFLRSTLSLDNDEKLLGF